MAYSEFYMDSGTVSGVVSSNLNAGSTSGAVVYTSTAGNWDGTSVFTPTDGQTTTSLVSVGDWASVYPTGNSVTPYVAKVTAVGAGVNGTITLSTTLKFGTAPTSNSGSRECRTGGAWADLGMLASGAALNTGTVTQSTRINIRAGTYANSTTTRTFGMAGTVTIPLWYRGYKTAIGDQDSNAAASAGTDIPALTFTTGQMVLSSGFVIFSNLDINSACLTANGAVAQTSSTGTTYWYRVRITNTSNNAAARCLSQTAASTMTCVACYFSAGTGATVINLTASLTLIGCYLKGGNLGVSVGTSSCSAWYTVFDAIGGDAMNCSTGGIAALHCSFYAPTGNAILFTGNVRPTILNCHFENVNQASKAGVNNTSGTNIGGMYVGNSFYNCTANYSGITENFIVFDNGTLGGSGFNAPASHDFTATTYLKAIAFPGALENIGLTGYNDTGALQRIEPTASYSSEF
jgi:hypothetical protein